MMWRLSIRIFAALFAVGALVGCASVKSTEMYYVAYTPKVYPPKSPDTEIPILGKAPAERHVTIGGLTFETDQGWRFLRKSMVYNAQVHGADAVVLKSVSNRREVSVVQVPPQMDWVPITNWHRSGRNGRNYSTTTWVPFYRPGYVQPVVEEITGIDAEMIVFKN